MSLIRLPPIDPSLYSLPVEQQIKSLGDYLMRYRRETEYLLNGSLDAGNISKGIFMEPGSAISWAQITDADQSVVDAWAASGYATYIDANGVYSGTFTGGLFKINPDVPVAETGVAFGGWYNGEWRENMAKFGYYEGDWPCFYLDDGGFGTTFYVNLDTQFNGSVSFYGNVAFNGVVDFTNATVIGL